MKNTSPKTILIVDDLPKELGPIPLFLNHAGFQTVMIPDGETAVTYVEHNPPDLILLDVLMPGIDGFETCRRLKEHHRAKDIPVIFLSALNDAEDKVNGFKSGGVDYVTKPVGYEEIVSRVNTHLAIRELQQRLQTQNARLQEQNAQLQTEISIRKQAEESLQVSEQQYRAVVETQTELICRFLSDGTLTFTNQAYARYFGNVPEALIGQSFFSVIPEDDLKNVLEYLANLKKVLPMNPIEHRAILPDDEIRWQQWTYHMIADRSDEGEREFQAVGRDITEYRRIEEELTHYHEHLYELVQERTQALTKTNELLQQEIADRNRVEQALRVSEQQYRYLAEHIADGIAIVQHDKLCFVNMPLATMFRYPKDQLPGKRICDIFYCECQHEHDMQLQRLLDREIDTFSWQERCITGNNRKIWTEIHHKYINWSGQPAILLTVREITEHKRHEVAMEHENLALKATLSDRTQFGEIIGKSLAMQYVYELIIKAAATKVSVVIHGETGVGKELVARTIHELSDRRHRAFVAVNCGAVTEALFEREFFGHRKGAFTGADRDKQGFFDRAHQGTLFLDELGELTLPEQVILLRALDRGEYTPIGDNTSKKADVRIIAATHRNLDEMRQQRLLREDFYYRIGVLAITVPPLRERREDLPLLIEYFLEKYRAGKSHKNISGRLMEQFMAYDWPGNVRELQNKLQRYLTIGQIDLPHSLPSDARSAQPVPENPPLLTPEGPGLYATLHQLEKQMILDALKRCQGKKQQTADLLGIERRTLYKKIRKYGIKRAHYVTKRE